jgi:large subunit ribosomal protein L12
LDEEVKNMEYVYAAMILHKAGKKINEENLSQVLKAAGITTDEARIKALVASLDEVDIDEAIKSAPTMMAAPVAGATTPTSTEKETGTAKEEKKEEDKQKEEEALEGLGALFG